MRQLVWEAAHVERKEVTLDTDTTAQTVYGRQMGARSDHYAEKGILARLMDRLRSILPGQPFAPVRASALRL
jgi:hypothetical protein